MPRSENYLLGPGDVLRVSVAGFPEFGQESVVIPPDGTVSLPRLGTIRLSGRTRASVQNEIRQRLISRVRLRNPQVAVAITEVRSGVVGSVVLAGDVPRGGNFSLREDERLSDLLAEAGLSERLEERRAVLVRGKQRTALNLSAAARTPGSAADIRLRAGDSIAVSAVPVGKITLQGDVERPGVYELHRKPSADASELGLFPRLSDLITRAGGLRDPESGSGTGSGAGVGAPNGVGAGIPGRRNPFAPGGGTASPAAGANLSPYAITTPLPNSALGGLGVTTPAPGMKTTYAATLQRSGTRRELDIDAALADVSGPENITLRAGDYISIRVRKPITVLLDGAATKVGSFQVAPGAGVLELLTLAGPLTRAPGDLRGVIRRGDESIPLNLPALLLSNDPAANERLQNGDIVQLREPETLNVSVAGQVVRPGEVKIRPGATIFEALLAAGGVTAGIPLDGARLNVLRRESNGSQRIYAANAAGILKLTDVSTNLVLREGDIVNISPGESPTVFVSGQVQNPGSFQITGGEGLPEVITRAGGPKDDAALTRIRVTRGGQVQTVDAYDAVKNGRPLAFALQAGDIVSIPVTTNLVSVVGAVSKPGYVPIPEKGQLRLLDALTQAGPVPGAKKLYILKANADGSINVQASSKEQISIDDIQRGRKPNVILAPRDIIYVIQPSNRSTNFLDLLGPLSAIRFFF